MKVKKFGDWKRLDAVLKNCLPARMEKALNRAATKCALLLVREIKKGIKAQAPGGKKFTPLAEATIEKKGSSKALIDTGFLLSAITQKIVSDKAFVGLLRGTRNKDGDEIVNIGAIMEFGATVQMPSGATIVIPARPFLHPVMEKYLPEIKAIFAEEILGLMH
jgi:phage gpG-like protein